MKIFTLLSMILSLIIFFFLSTSLLLEVPVINNDEALISDISLNLLRENRMGTDLWKGLLNGVENHAYWIPPVYFYLNAFWFNLLGFSIENLRLLSVLLGAAAGLLFFFLFRLFLDQKSSLIIYVLASITTIILLSDTVFLRASRVGRPEMLMLLLALLSLYSYIKSLYEREKRLLYSTLSGFFLGLAIASHLIAVSFAFALFIHLLIRHKLSSFKQKSFYLLFGISLIPSLIWLASIYPHYNYLFEQLSLVSQSRSYSISWHVSVSTFPNYFFRINYFFYLLISVIFIWFTINNRKNLYVLLSLLLVSFWTFATLGKIYWYTIYPVPFVYIALGILIRHFLAGPSKTLPLKLKKAVWIFIPLFLFISNLSIFYEQYTTLSQGTYNQLKEQILSQIPEGKTVYLSSLPDAYFIFKNGEISRNKIYEWPVLRTDDQNHKKILDESDYIVINGLFAEPNVSNFVYSYIGKNQQKSTEFIEPNNIEIIELKDKNKREDVL